MTTSTQTDSTKHLTLVYRITSPAQQTKLLAEGQWVASAHSDVLAERDALQRRANSMEQEIERLQQRLINVNGYHQAWAAHAQELEKQLEAVGAGGVEPLRRVKCLHQIEEPVSGVRCKIIENCKSCQYCAGRQGCTLAQKEFDNKQRPDVPPDWCPLPLYSRQAAAQDPAAEPQPVAHPDDAAVDALAVLMKAKLAKQRKKGYGGWETPECTQRRLSTLLRDHIDKGDPVDVANFCAFLSARGEGIAPQSPAPVQGPVPALQIESLPAMAREIFCNYPTKTQKEIDDVIEWFASSIYVAMNYMQKAQPSAQIQANEPFAHDEELLEQLYWDFDHESSKGGQDRLVFKGKLRFYAEHVASKATAP